MTRSTGLNSAWAGILARHLADAAAESGDLAAAEARVAAALPAAMRDEVALVARLVREGGGALDPAQLRRSMLRGLIELLDAAPTEGFARTRALHLFEGARAELAPTLDASEARLGAVAGYLAVLATAFLLLLTVVWLYVLPQFMSLYAEFGAALPALTRLVLSDAGGVVVVVLAAAVASVAIGMLAFRFHARRQFRALCAFDPRLYWVPLVRDVAFAYDSALYLAYARVLVASGCPPTEAHRVAGRLTGVELATDPATAAPGRPSEIAASFAIAAALGRDAEELDYQFASSARGLVGTLDQALTRVNATAKTVLFVTIGLVVIAVYLPIFKIGSII